MIEINCPHCGHQLRIRAAYRGKHGKCKHCGGRVDVPADAESSDTLNTLPNELPKPIGEESTALADLVADGENPNPTPPPAQPAEPELQFDAFPPPRHQRHKPLGVLYWLLAIFLTPAALIWGIVLPSGHPQKRMAILVPIILIGAGFLLFVFLAVFVILPLGLITVLDFQGGDAVTDADSGGLVITPSAIEMEVSPHAYERLETNSEPGMENDLTWRSSDPSVVKVIGQPRSATIYGISPGTATITAENIVSGEQATATVQVVPATTQAPEPAPAPRLTYERTRLPEYPDMTFEITDESANELGGPLADADPSTLTTFEGYTPDYYEDVTAHFFQTLQDDGWEIADYGYADQDNGETYMFGEKEGFGFVYRTQSDGTGTQVVITYGLTGATL
jgi:hypothetical protein